jgi:glycine/D-amino acid oxidase-like deaminating enzyme
MTDKRVAVLGGGLMGCCTALYLARRGASVTLFEQHPVPMSGASRWNEGKIHLGYLYGADASLASCRMMLPGGLRFVPMMEELVGASADAHLTQEDDILLFHRHSVIGLEENRRVLDAVSALVREHPDARHYPGDPRDARVVPLGREELASLSRGPDIAAGHRVPERSMNTLWLADRVVDAMDAEPRVNFACGTRVTGLAKTDRWTVSTEHGAAGGFDVVVNALWNGKLAIDRAAGLPIGETWSHRYRVAVFVRTSRPVDVASAVVAVGAFGDVKNFGGRDFYVSWYPVGLRLDSAELDPSPPSPLSQAERTATIDAIRTGLGAHVAGIDRIFEAAETVRVEGGFVFADGGRGRIDQASSTLHARDRFGVRRRGSYVSVDTGKWSTAPWLAEAVANDIAGAAPAWVGAVA